MTKKEKNMIREIKRAIRDFSMIQDWDIILIGVSWGKDSMLLGTLMKEIQRHTKEKFEMRGVYIFKEFLINCDIEFEEKRKYYEEILNIPLEKVNIEIPKDSKLNEWVGQSCQRCAYARRIALLKLADKYKATKICLGHHMDDIVVTSFLNMTGGRNLKVMPPVNTMECGNFQFIRPMAYLREKDIMSLCLQKSIPFSPCSCPVGENTMRNKMKKELLKMEKVFPNFIENTFWALIKDFQEKYKDKNYVVK